MSLHRAPWGVLLTVISAVLTVVFLAIATAPWEWTGTAETAGPLYWLRFLPIALLIVCALFTVRGYSVSPGWLHVRRLLWFTSLPLDELHSAEVRPRAMRHSLRLLGNGGLYSVSGLYRNRDLGNYRAFVTDFHRTVILRFKKRTIVVSPEDPEAFVREIRDVTGVGTEACSD